MVNSVMSSLPNHSYRETRSRVSQRFTYPYYPGARSSSSAWKPVKPFSASPWRHFLSRAISHRAFAVLVCYTGALVQTAVLTQIYFEFKTSTSVQIKSPQQTDLPAISICFFYKISGLKLIPLGNNISQTSLTLGEIDSRLLSWSEFVKNCYVMDSEYVFRPCEDISQEKAEFISLYSKCFTLFTNTTVPISYSKELIGSNRMVDFTLNVSHPVITKVGVYLTHPISELDDVLGTPSFVYFDTKHNNRATISYHKTIIHSLPEPYESRCYDYSKLPCKERRTCIKKCTLEMSYNESKGFINRRFTKISDEVKDGRFGIRNHLDNHTGFCNAQFLQAPCNEYLYQAIMGSEFESPFINRGDYRVSIDYPLGTETRIQYVPSRSFLDYICFSASVLSLWTEISLIRLVQLSTKAMITFICRYLNNDKRIYPDDSIKKTTLTPKSGSKTNLFGTLSVDSITLSSRSLLNINSSNHGGISVGGNPSPSSISIYEVSPSRHRFNNYFQSENNSDKKNSR
uniref:Uncharacterized protein n=1 Tax=Tetranychus urticae TaxID=32264 RepID=T1KK82_TETUR